MNEWKELNGIVEVAEAVAAGMEIEWQYISHEPDCWFPWDSQSWGCTVKYRARPRKPAKAMVKSLCWRQMDSGDLIWMKDTSAPLCVSYQRFPAGDIEGEVEA